MQRRAHIGGRRSARPGASPVTVFEVCHRGRLARGRATVADNQTSLVSLPLFPLGAVLHPGDEGVLTVFEPRYLELFRTLRDQTPPGSEPRFGHILAAEAAPPALLESAVGGLPAIGVCAAARAIRDAGDGRLVVEYAGQRRFKLLAVDEGLHPYLVGAASWYDDEAPPDAEAGGTAATDALELRVWAALQGVSKYSRALGLSDGALPPALLRYSPPPPSQAPSAGAGTLVRHDLGRPAAGDAATWRRHGSVYGGPAKAKAPSPDPYLTLREAVGRGQRRELFSFAAASMLQMGLPERLALLQAQDTEARLHFVLAALAPFLAELVARASVKAAID